MYLEHTLPQRIYSWAAFTITLALAYLGVHAESPSKLTLSDYLSRVMLEMSGTPRALPNAARQSEQYQRDLLWLACRLIQPPSAASFTPVRDYILLNVAAVLMTHALYLFIVQVTAPP